MPTLEQRVSDLEEKVARLLREDRESQDKPWWERHLGAFKNDPMYDEAMRLGREWRESQPIPPPDDESDS
jgi:hypothetical protein